MVFGQFGGAHTDYVCVQSMDGQLGVFEQETLAFARYLPNFLIPGPLVYCRQIDSFLTCNSCFELECYKYHVLASSSADRLRDGEMSESWGLTAKKQVQVDWKLSLGEAALQIVTTANFSTTGGVNESGGQRPGSRGSASTDIVVLAERTLFVVSEAGYMKSQKKLDFVPAVCRVFPVRPEMGDNSPVHLLVADSTGSVMVYRGMQLLWASKCDVPPVALSIARFGTVGGLLVGLADNGLLGVSYMGMEPPVTVVGGYEGKELHYEEMDDEHRRLLGIIRESTSEIKAEPVDVVQIRVQVPTNLDGAGRGAGGRGEIDIADESPPGVAEGGCAKTLTMRVFISYTGASTLENVHISVTPPAPVQCQKNSFIVPTLDGGADTPVIIPISLNTPQGGGCIPANQTVIIMAGYKTRSGEPRSANCEVQLPLALFCTVVPPVKSARHKVTLDTNRMPPQLTGLFEEVVMQSPGAAEHSAAGNVISFQYNNRVDVTIIVSKNAGRFRLQSSRFEAIWLILQELVQRLNKYFEAEDAKPGEEPFMVSFEDALPLQDFFGIVDRHHAVRQQYAANNVRLGNRARQFRAIQKRLLMRFKDKNPVALVHLDSLLEGTFHQINQEASGMDSIQQTLTEVSESLAAAVQMILLLIQLRFGIGEDGLRVLRSYIAPVVQDTLEQGWEEWTEAAVTNLLKTLLAKSTKEGVYGAAGNQPLTPLQDTSKLKKHISVVCERLARGGNLCGPIQ
jgi:Bardet-Biedl syndrome 9 protein